MDHATNLDGNAISVRERKRPVKGGTLDLEKSTISCRISGDIVGYFRKSPHALLAFGVGLAARAYVTDMECLSLSATTSRAPRSGRQGRSTHIAFAESGNMPRKAATPPPLLES